MPENKQPRVHSKYLQRKEIILELIGKRHSVSTQEIKHRFEELKIPISRNTILSDIEILVHTNLVEIPAKGVVRMKKDYNTALSNKNPNPSHG